MREDDYETAIKVVIVGNGSVGKSSLIQRFCHGTFTSEYKRTIGVDFLERSVNDKNCLRIGNQEIRLMLWDTAGQEEFGALTKAYYRGAHACIIAFSTTDRQSFASVKSWKSKVEFECGSIPMVVVQNKIDLLANSVVSFEEVDSLCRQLKLKLFRTSVKEALNVKEGLLVNASLHDSRNNGQLVFQFVAECYVHSIAASEEELVPSFSTSTLKSALMRPSIVDTPIAKTTNTSIIADK
ncbi:hypothetical protein B4U80_00370 [Leptotrombidium deliense]|uniref:Ras-related protein Rab-23-like protein n=1 Tax=Leptotrombidium deliense TaxID=299467 RepID=A0A443S4F4_9ACAR|nr:hypothetical protein B4U80_00370 [Leptotrombidium deliense]